MFENKIEIKIILYLMFYLNIFLYNKIVYEYKCLSWGKLFVWVWIL